MLKHILPVPICWFTTYVYTFLQCTDMEHPEFNHAQQAKTVHLNKNTKEKLLRTNAATWFNKMSRSTS